MYFMLNNYSILLLLAINIDQIIDIYNFKLCKYFL